MNKTGVIRRIDNLGRIVIPKEIRSTLRIKNGDNLEIYIDKSENIVLKKFSIVDKISDLSNSVTEAIYSLTKATVILSNNDRIISINGKYKKELDKKEISTELSELIENNNDLCGGKGIKITNENEYDEYYLLEPIISGGDKIGALIILDDEIIKNDYEIIAKLASSFLGKYVE